MSDLKISQLPNAGPLTGSEPWPVVQSGVTVQTKGSDLVTYLSTSFLPVSSGLSDILSKGSSTGAYDIVFSNQSASTVPVLDSSKKLVSSGVTPTELGYLSGVTTSVQGQIEQLKVVYWKEPCLVSTTRNEPLNGTTPVDGISIRDNDRVLVQFQDNPVENGIYLVRADRWQRADDFRSPDDHISGAVVTVQQGLLYGGKGFVCTNADPVLIDGQAIVFKPYGSGTLADVLANGNATGAGNNIVFSTLASNTVPYVDGSNMLASSAVTAAELGYVHGVTSAIQTQLDGMNLSAVLAHGNSTGSGNVVFNQQTANTVPYLDGSKQLVSSSVTPTELGYVSGARHLLQAQIDTISWKNPCDIATVANMTLSGTPTINGVTVQIGWRVLVWKQAAASTNGIYVAGAGAWTRAEDFGTSSYVNGVMTVIMNGTYKNLAFMCTNNTFTRVGTDPVNFAQFNAYTGVSPVIVNGTTISLDATIFNLSGILGISNSTGAHDISFAQQNANTVPYFDSSKILKSSTVTPTELSYLSGVTSSIQSQINAISYTGATGQINVSGGVISISSSYEPALANSYIGVGSGSGQLSGSSGLTFNGSVLYTSGNLQAAGMSGSGARLVQADDSGNLSATSEVVEQWITDAGTQSNLSDPTNWSGGNYTGPGITATYQSQTYYDSQYFFMCVSDNNWIRMQRV